MSIDKSWRPILYGVFKPLTDYGFAVRHVGDKPIAKIVARCTDDLISRNKAPQWIVGEAGGRAFFGRFGEVGELLGYGHPAAKDGAGRKLDFFLGYSAPVGSSVVLPRVSELSLVDETMKLELQRLWQQSIDAKDLSSTSQVAQFSFSGKPATDHPWDHVVNAIENRKPSVPLLIDRQGSTRQEGPAIPTSVSSPDVPNEQGSEEKQVSSPDPKDMTATDGRQSRREFVMAAGVVTSLLAILAGWAAWMGFQKANKQQDRGDGDSPTR